MEKIKMKIPFDIKYRPQIESGEYKVVTRDEHPVRIICWDRKSAGDGQPIVALVENGHYENSIWVEENGVYKGNMGHEYDLFIITPEPELTEFEEKVKELIGSYPHATNENKGSILYEVQKAAAELLELAKKEICKGCTVSIDSYIKGREDARKEAEKSYTFYYPTYEPPCFHGGICTNPMRDCINCPMHSSGATTNTTSGTCKKD